MNAIYSYLFNVEISDQPILAKNSKKGLTYGELRILSFLRNPLFNIEEFQKREILLDNGQNEHTVDYSIMRVIEIFYSFVKEPVRIDNLIVTHKYICDVWKNGSKHLYRNDYPALVVELKWNKSAKSALQQIKDRKYPASIEQYTGDILLVGINYDKKTKKHECVIEQ